MNILHAQTKGRHNAYPISVKLRGDMLFSIMLSRSWLAVSEE